MKNLPSLSLKKQRAIQKLKQKKYRKIENAFLCEGFRLFDAAMQMVPKRIREIVLSTNLLTSRQGILITKTARNNNIPIFIADPRVIALLSDEVTPAGLIFSVEKASMSRQVLASSNEEIMLYFDRLTDPGNLGTLIRSAAWFGVPVIILSPGCVDPFNPKVVRASAGAIFEIAICPEIEFDWLNSHFKKNNYQFIATVAGQGQAPKEWHVGSKSLIFFGREATGLDEQILQAADIRLKIPGSGKIESLNISAAASVIMYEIYNRKIKK